MPPRTTLSKGFQITLPSVIRKKLNLKVGDPIEFSTTNNAIIIKKGLTLDEQVDEMIAAFDAINAKSDKYLTPEQKDFNKRATGWTVNQFHEYFDKTPRHQAYLKEKFNV